MEIPIQLASADTGQSSHASLLLTAEQVAASLAVCRTKVYELLRNGELESVRIGSSRRIPVAALDEYVEGLRAQARVSSDTQAPRPTVLG